ncbi:MAG: AAA family ATPase [Candidatus Eremiobacteraeota bacterium]|nr:AAA family ATPase [Candidatus Eremiobacteraeota bacterium]
MSVAIVGGPGTGKTTLLIERYRAAVARDGAERTLLLAPTPFVLDALRRRLGEPAGTTFGALAAELTGTRIVDEIAAEALFERAAAPLLALEWPEIMDATVDIEVSGLRMPSRFLESAFRLVRKLRESVIAPEVFLQSSMVGATSFYGHTPNLAHSDLLMYTKETHRDSLAVDGAELQRQFKHEIYLAKILAKLYRSYVDLQEREGAMTGRDAIVEAIASIGARADLQAAVRARWSSVFVDEAQELNLGELGLLQAIRGAALDDVTLAGDPNGATGTFRGARPDRVFALATERIESADRHRTRQTADPSAPHLRLYRARDQRAEAEFVADEVAEFLRSGTPPDEIAVLFRSVRHVRIYEEALLTRDVPAIAVGDANVFEDPRALDAMALLWNVYDPFRHDYMLRTLAGPAMALSDATLASLCGEPPDAQTLLFEEDDASPATRARRWDPRRDLRLGWNVTRGEADASLSDLARARLERFRALRAGWVEVSSRIALVDLARLVWSEGLAQRGAPTSAPARTQAAILRRLVVRIARFAEANASATLGDFLTDAEVRAQSEFESCEESAETGFVRLISIEAARGSEFDRVVVPNAKPGAFPRWYVPDSFVYSPNLGTIAKDNVGDGTAARTAKFSYYVYRTKARERYNEEERRAFNYALSRARKTALVTAWDRPTRGLTAPEFLQELRAARSLGSEDLTPR